jgi:hypothetical protein
VKATKPQSIDNNKMNAHWRSSTSYCIGQEMSSVDCSTCEGHPQHSASGKQKKKKNHRSQQQAAHCWELAPDERASVAELDMPYRVRV